jgi:para-aminobenzoate synthetase component 1
MTSECNLPLIQEIDTDLSPPDAFEIFKDRRHSFFLDSGMDPHKLGRYSFIGSQPFLVMKSRGDSITFSGSYKKKKMKGNPFDILAILLKMYSMEKGASPVPFTGGAVGYLSYDLRHFIEKLPKDAIDDLELPESYLGFYDTLLAFDNLLAKTYIVSTGFPETDDRCREERASSRLEEVRRDLLCAGNKDRRKKTVRDAAAGKRAELKSGFSHKEYIAAVKKARQYIIEGDIFEVNLSQRFEAELNITPYELYKRLRRINPAPFAGYLNFRDVAVVSASPERFIHLRGDSVETRPIKGTRPRGENPQQDEALADELLNSPKDRAENIMIVDLERNDLGRVCRYGSVKVTELAILEVFPTVFHLTSTIIGRLNEDKKAIDLLRAVFPGGSITGAPKVRAMEIIDEIEPTRRSVYTGSIGYLGFNGDIDLNIAIRTIIVKKNKAYFQVGGAIVYDSDPEAEYQETLHKAKAMIDSLNTTGDEG